MMGLNLQDIEAIELVDATVFIFESDERKSSGCLFLSPQSSIEKHNRPIEEWLIQIEGECNIKLFNGNVIEKEITLKRGDSLRVPANQYHQHSNNSSKESLTSWHFDGDITELIDKLRKKSS